MVETDIPSRNNGKSDFPVSGEDTSLETSSM